jgi:hypothetical protein
MLMACLLVIGATAASDAAWTTYKFALSGTGSFMNSPPTFSGDIVGGTLSPGTFWIQFDDTGWPVDNPATTENERMDYLISHYFEYDDEVGAEGWDAYFSAGSGESAPTWRFYTEVGDTLGGSCTQITITVRDINANAVMEDDEYATKVIGGNIVAYINYGGGCFENLCGMGSFSGMLSVVDSLTMEEELYVPSPTSASGRLSLHGDGCVVGVEPSSWGQIKSIYR